MIVAIPVEMGGDTRVRRGIGVIHGDGNVVRLRLALDGAYPGVVVSVSGAPVRFLAPASRVRVQSGRSRR